MVCTFFGHRDCPETIRAPLKRACEELIQNHSVNRFYVGNHGAFDREALGVLKGLAAEYPHIHYEVVLAYRPSPKIFDSSLEWTHTVLPNGVEKIPPSAAIPWRNQWMVQQADYVIAYITRPLGGAFRYVELAKRQGKTVIYVTEP